jgi:hypothetical protein
VYHYTKIVYIPYYYTDFENRIKLDANSAEVGDRLHVLRKELKARDSDKVVLASTSGRLGSDAESDAGFALRRFLENESVIDPDLENLTKVPSDFGGSLAGDESTVADGLQSGQKVSFCYV